MYIIDAVFILCFQLLFNCASVMVVIKATSLLLNFIILILVGINSSAGNHHYIQRTFQLQNDVLYSNRVVIHWTLCNYINQSKKRVALEFEMFVWYNTTLQELLQIFFLFLFYFLYKHI